MTSEQIRNVVDLEFKATYNGWHAAGFPVDHSVDAAAVVCDAQVTSTGGPKAAVSTMVVLDDPRERQTVALPGGKSVTLPRNFSFILTGELAVSSTPTHREHIAALSQLGVGLVITLTAETPLESEWFAESDVKNLFVPVPNYEPPTVAQMDLIVNEVARAVSAGSAVMEHCGGGKGRAGTVAACLLLRFGTDGILTATRAESMNRMSSADAIQYIRRIRPGSIETTQQEDFVRRYASHLWALSDSTSGSAAADQTDCVPPAADADKRTLPSKSSTKAAAKAKRAAKGAEKARKAAMKRAPDVIIRKCRYWGLSACATFIFKSCAVHNSHP